jgi:hypothetical protein
MSAEFERKIEENAPIIKDEFKCPVCTNLYIKPTMFECGHTLCITCHYKLDASSTTPTFTVPSFKCPMCRFETTIPWRERPTNTALDSICKSTYPKEYGRIVELETKCAQLSNRLKRDVLKLPGLDESLRSVNLSETVNQAQEKLSEKVYCKLMPIFMRAANQGKSYISITQKKLVSDIEVCIQPLTKKLFDNNNVYKITCTPEECTVFFSKCSMNWGREFCNSNHTGPNNSPLTPQSPPPPGLRTRIFSTSSTPDADLSYLDRFIVNGLLRPRLSEQNNTRT